MFARTFALLRFQFYLLNLFKDYAGEQLALVLRVGRGSPPRGREGAGENERKRSSFSQTRPGMLFPAGTNGRRERIETHCFPDNAGEGERGKRAGECSLAKGRKARDVTRETFLSPPDDAFAASPPLHRCFSSSWMSERAKRPPLSTLLLVLLPLSPKRSHSLPLHLTREVGGGEREQSSACLLACLCVL